MTDGDEKYRNDKKFRVALQWLIVATHGLNEYLTPEEKRDLYATLHRIATRLGDPIIVENVDLWPSDVEEISKSFR